MTTAPQTQTVTLSHRSDNHGGWWKIGGMRVSSYRNETFRDHLKGKGYQATGSFSHEVAKKQAEAIARGYMDKILGVEK